MSDVVGIVASLMITVAGALLVTLVARLAAAAHRAADLGDADAPWGHVAAAAAILGVVFVHTAIRSYVHGVTPLNEAVVRLVLTVAAAFLLSRYLNEAARARTGARLEGGLATGAILLATGVASAVVVTVPVGTTIPVRLNQAVFGATLATLAFTAAEVGAFVRALHGARGVARWVTTFATVASQAFVVVAYVRAITLNSVLAGGSATPVRLGFAFGLLLAAGFAAPAVATARELLLARPAPPAPAAADAGSQAS